MGKFKMNFINDKTGDDIMVEMKQKPVNKILCILLTLALVITTMPLTAETAYAAQAAMYMDYDFRVECSDVSLEWNNGDK